MNLRIAFFVVVTALFFTGCNGNDDSNDDSQLTILVTNDDGIGAPGIDRLVNKLIALENVDVQVVAPAVNQSGSSDKTTDGEVVWENSATITGYSGIAVFGFPADAVNVALDQLDIIPNLVVSGVNSGQNVGTFALVSGTVGAAQTAARAGFPAVAASAGPGDVDADFDATADLVIAWINDNRSALANNSANVETVTSFNVPECTAGTIRGLVVVPLADFGDINVFSTDCSVEPDSDPVNDVDAILKGFSAETQLPLEF